MNLSLFLARRFFRSGHLERRSKASTPAIRIATVGVALGLAVMIISVCVVRGFQNEVAERIAGFTSHVEIIDLNSFSSPETFPIVTDRAVLEQAKSVAGVKNVSRFAEKMGILKTETDFQAISLKGVGEDYDLSFLKRHLVSGKLPAFSDTASTNKVVISQMMSDALGLKVGDHVFAYFFEETVKMRRFEIAAIYRTNMRQFDRTFALTDLHTVVKLNSWEANQSSGLEVRVNDFDQVEQVAAHLNALFKDKVDEKGGRYAVLSVKDNPRTQSVFSWLNLLNVNVWVILVLVVCVAGFTMISGLLILILERTTTIGVLKALGATNARIRHTFLYYAAFIVGRGLVIGDVLALFIIWLQKQYGVFRLNPETYYVDMVPVELNGWIIVALNVGTLLLTVGALILPSFMISRIQPAKAIRFD